MRVIANQSLLDIAIQEEGTILTTFEWAVINGKSVTDDLTPGEVLIAPNSIYKNIEVSNHFKNKQQKIATNIPESQEELEALHGIGSMIIETNFKVK